MAGSPTPLSRLGQRLSRHARNRDAEGRDESGAVLVLALIFLVAVSLIVSALLTFVGTSLSATTNFNNERNLEYATTSTVNLAIQQTRSTFNASLLEASPPQPCWGTGTSSLAINGYTINVWCSMTWKPFSGSTRTITYSACPQYGQSNVPDAWQYAWQCAQTPLLQAIMTFDDYAANSPVTSEPEPCSVTKTCGQTQDQLSWLWSPILPQVTSVTGAAGPANVATPFTINGTGFVQGSSVSLVWETGPNAESWTYPANAVNQPQTDQFGSGVIVQATNVAVNAAGTQITATAPPTAAGPYFFVTVTTPGGTSSYQNLSTMAYNVFTYAPQGPHITAVKGSVSVTGGGLVTITGTGFYNAPNFTTQVWFVQGASQVAASNVNVSASGNSLTAISPTVSSSGNWSIEVETLGGTSTESITIGMSVQVPIITSLSPYSSGANPAQLTINGANFLSGASVWFCATASSSLSSCEAGTASSGEIAASATVASSGTSIAVSVPTNTMTANSTYYPIVQLPSPYNTSQYPPSQPYNLPYDIFTFT